MLLRQDGCVRASAFSGIVVGEASLLSAIDGEWIEALTGQEYDIAKLSEFGLKIGLSIYMN